MAIKKIEWSSKLVEDAIEKIQDGFQLKRENNPFHENTIGFRKQGLNLKMTENEIEEYVKSGLDINYFAEKYCYVKGEEGQPVIIKLRDYQKEILKNFKDNRFNILMASRQVGKCISFNSNMFILEGDVIRTERIGKIYYDELSKQRKLTLLERIKIKLYDLIYFLEK